MNELERQAINDELRVLNATIVERTEALMEEPLPVGPDPTVARAILRARELRKRLVAGD